MKVRDTKEWDIIVRNTGRDIREDFWLVYCLEPRGVKDSSPGNDLCKLHCTALHWMALYCTELHCTALFNKELHCTASHGTVQHCTVQHYPALDKIGGVVYSTLFNIAMNSMGFKVSHYSIELAVCPIKLNWSQLSLWGEGGKASKRGRVWIYKTVWNSNMLHC